VPEGRRIFPGLTVTENIGGAPASAGTRLASSQTWSGCWISFPTSAACATP
jgi:ABC-type branched-subunit amino acid transport system ATPase component